MVNTLALPSSSLGHPLPMSIAPNGCRCCRRQSFKHRQAPARRVPQPFRRSDRLDRPGAGGTSRRSRGMARQPDADGADEVTQVECWFSLWLNLAVVIPAVAGMAGEHLRERAAHHHRNTPHPRCRASPSHQGGEVLTESQRSTIYQSGLPPLVGEGPRSTWWVNRGHGTDSAVAEAALVPIALPPPSSQAGPGTHRHPVARRRSSA